MEDSLNRHFIRGYFDGDGSISHSDKIISMNIVSASLDFLKTLSEKIHIISGCKFANLTGIHTFKYITYTRYDDLFKIYNLFYNSSELYMGRKMDKFTFIVNNYKDLRKITNIYGRDRYRNRIK